MIIHTWRTIIGHVPNDIYMQFVDNRLFGVYAIVLALRKYVTSKDKAFYDRSFHVKTAELWNLLPAKTKDFDSLDKFKISLLQMM